MHEQMRVPLCHRRRRPSQFPPIRSPVSSKWHRFRLLQLLPHLVPSGAASSYPCSSVVSPTVIAIQLTPAQIRKQAADLLQRHLVVDREFGHQRPYPAARIAPCWSHTPDIPALRLPTAFDFAQAVFGDFQLRGPASRTPGVCPPRGVARPHQSPARKGDTASANARPFCPASPPPAGFFLRDPLARLGARFSPLGRAGCTRFFRYPSLEGGLWLLLLFISRRRRSSAFSACKRAISARSSAFSCRAVSRFRTTAWQHCCVETFDFGFLLGKPPFQHPDCQPLLIHTDSLPKVW